MREILFRGKCIGNGEWAKGSLVIWGDGSCWIDSGSLTEPMACVIPKTVGQFTGLTDKNGTKIFEGDILALRTGRPHIVKFEDGGFVLTDTAIPIRHADKLVIGNIHDNPELLGGES